MFVSFELVGFDVLETELEISYLVVGHILGHADEVVETENIVILGVVVNYLFYIARVEPSPRVQKDEPTVESEGSRLSIGKWDVDCLEFHPTFDLEHKVPIGICPSRCGVPQAQYVGPWIL